MSVRRLAKRLLGAATVATLAVTGIGVLLAPTGTVAAQTPAGKDGKGAVTAVSAVQAGITARTAGVPLPEVDTQEEADLANGDALPEGARVFNTGSNSTGMAVRAGALAHGKAEGPGAAGFVETKLTGKVRQLGARVRFADAASGSVALVGWQSSLVDADRKGTGTPATGMRLVASPGRWELTVVDGEVHVIGSGTYEVTDGPATFELFREGGRLYVVDPTGVVTVVEDRRADRLAGPWASWGLSETGPEQIPASIEAIWAG